MPEATLPPGLTPAALIEMRAELVVAHFILNGPDWMTPAGRTAHANARAAVKRVSDRIGQICGHSSIFDDIEIDHERVDHALAEFQRGGMTA